MITNSRRLVRYTLYGPRPLPWWRHPKLVAGFSIGCFVAFFTFVLWAALTGCGQI